MVRVATADAPDGKQAAATQSVFTNGLLRIPGTAWIKTARWRHEGADKKTIGVNYPDC